MQPIHPICEETVKPHMGKHVCVVLTDGTEVYGTLGGLQGNQLVLNSCYPGGEGIATSSTKGKGRSKSKGKQVRTSGFGYYPPYPYGGALLLDLALIAFLFAVPFLWI